MKLNIETTNYPMPLQLLGRSGPCIFVGSCPFSSSGPISVWLQNMTPIEVNQSAAPFNSVWCCSTWNVVGRYWKNYIIETQDACTVYKIMVSQFICQDHSAHTTCTWIYKKLEHDMFDISWTRPAQTLLPSCFSCHVHVLIFDSNALMRTSDIT